MGVGNEPADLRRLPRRSGRRFVLPPPASGECPRMGEKRKFSFAGEASAALSENARRQSKPCHVSGGVPLTVRDGTSYYAVSNGSPLNAPELPLKLAISPDAFIWQKAQP